MAWSDSWVDMIRSVQDVRANTARDGAWFTQQFGIGAANRTRNPKKSLDFNRLNGQRGSGEA